MVIVIVMMTILSVAAAVVCVLCLLWFRRHVARAEKPSGSDVPENWSVREPEPVEAGQEESDPDVPKVLPTEEDLAECIRKKGYEPHVFGDIVRFDGYGGEIMVNYKEPVLSVFCRKAILKEDLPKAREFAGDIMKDNGLVKVLMFDFDEEILLVFSAESFTISKDNLYEMFEFCLLSAVNAREEFKKMLEGDNGENQSRETDKTWEIGIPVNTNTIKN